MFRIVCDPSSGSTELCLTEIILSGSQIFFVCLVGVWQRDFETVHTHHLLTYLLTPWSRVLLEKLTGSAASQEIPRIFGTRKFITVLTSARHLSLS